MEDENVLGSGDPTGELTGYELNKEDLDGLKAIGRGEKVSDALLRWAKEIGAVSPDGKLTDLGMSITKGSDVTIEWIQERD